MPKLTDSVPAHLTRTAGEFLGRRPLPKLLVSRPVIFLAGPEGSGRSSVAQKLVGAASLTLDRPALQQQLVTRARYNRFSTAIIQAPSLVLDGVDFLYHRDGPVKLLRNLLETRATAGRKTVVIQGSDESVELLYSAVPCELRASVLLRFPVGRGRRQFVKAESEKVGVPFHEARPLIAMEPWSYAGVRAAVELLAK